MLCPCVQQASRTHATRELRSSGPPHTRRPLVSHLGTRGFLLAGHNRKVNDERATQWPHRRRESHRCPEPDQVPRARRRDRHLRHPGRHHPPGVRPALRQLDPAHPGAPRAGRRPRRPGVRRGHRPGRRLHGHQRPGRHQPGHPAGRRQHGLGPAGRRHRPGRGLLDRHRRLPGGRHPRHHDADHQAQLPGHRPRRDPARGGRGLPHRLHRSARPGAGRRRQVGAAGDDHVRVADRAQPARLPPGDPAALQADPRGDPADPGVAPSGALRRRRRHPGAGLARAAARWPSSPASRWSPR